MTLRTMAVAGALFLSPVALAAQTTPTEQPADPQQQEQATASLRGQLMPTTMALRLTVPVMAEQPAAANEPVATLAASRSAGMPLMIAGGALFVAGLIAGGDGGTLLVIAGAGIGAYGLYLYFQ